MSLACTVKVNELHSRELDPQSSGGVICLGKILAKLERDMWRALSVLEPHVMER